MARFLSVEAALFIHREQIEAHGGFIRELIAAQGDMTLVEVQARLIERGAVGLPVLISLIFLTAALFKALQPIP